MDFEVRKGILSIKIVLESLDWRGISVSPFEFDPIPDVFRTGDGFEDLNA